MDWVELVLDGASGGVIVIWDRRTVELINHFVGDFLVACHFKSVIDGCDLAFASVYGSNLDFNRRFLWDEMAGICSWWHLPWYFGGDFNFLVIVKEMLIILMQC